MKVAFLGLGRIGRAMAAHVPRAGHELVVWNRTPGRAGDLVDLGAHEADGVAEAVSDADAVVVCVFGPEASRAVLVEVAEHAAAGTLVIDATTVAPADARAAEELLSGAGLRFVEAPVVGSLAPAAAGTLGVMVGGEAGDVASARPLLELWGDPRHIWHVGAVGQGAAAKLVVNYSLAVVMAGLGDALRLAHELGLDRVTALDALGLGPFSWTLDRKRPLLDRSDATETAFSLDLMAKDIALCVAASGVAERTEAAAGLQEQHPVESQPQADGEAAAGPVLAAPLLQALRAAQRAGRGDEDFTALALWLERRG